MPMKHRPVVTTLMISSLRLTLVGTLSCARPNLNIPSISFFINRSFIQFRNDVSSVLKTSSD